MSLAALARRCGHGSLSARGNHPSFRCDPTCRGVVGRTHENVHKRRLRLRCENAERLLGVSSDANPLRDEAGAPTGEAIVLRNMVGEAVHIVVFSGR